MEIDPNRKKPVATEKRDWTLSQQALDVLLARLDADRDRAGEALEKIRGRLARLFEWRGVLDPDELADQTIDRVACKLLEGAEIVTRDVYWFFHGVALNVLREHWRRQADRPEPPPAPVPAPEQVLLLLERAMAESLTPREREVIGGYYQGSKLKESRKELAAALNLSPNALRIRACRAREKLETYFRQRTDSG